jgi:hypothetical protein
MKTYLEYITENSQIPKNLEKLKFSIKCRYNDIQYLQFYYINNNIEYVINFDDYISISKWEKNNCLWKHECISKEEKDEILNIIVNSCKKYSKNDIIKGIDIANIILNIKDYINEINRRYPKGLKTKGISNKWLIFNELGTLLEKSI